MVRKGQFYSTIYLNTKPAPQTKIFVLNELFDKKKHKFVIFIEKKKCLKLVNFKLFVYKHRQK